jgi:hypothetical protein
MRTSAFVAIAACAIALAGHDANGADAAPTAAQQAASAPLAAPADEPERSRAGEPAVRHTVIDDGRARIEELRVRGQLQKVTVAPKGGAPRYEVLVGDGVQPMGDDPGTSRGSAGKRVWNVLRF